MDLTNDTQSPGLSSESGRTSSGSTYVGDNWDLVQKLSLKPETRTFVLEHPELLGILYCSAVETAAILDLIEARKTSEPDELSLRSPAIDPIPSLVESLTVVELDTQTQTRRIHSPVSHQQHPKLLAIMSQIEQIMKNLQQENVQLKRDHVQMKQDRDDDRVILEETREQLRQLRVRHDNVVEQLAENHALIAKLEDELVETFEAELAQEGDTDLLDDVHSDESSSSLPVTNSNVAWYNVDISTLDASGPQSFTARFAESRTGSTSTVPTSSLTVEPPKLTFLTPSIGSPISNVTLSIGSLLWKLCPRQFFSTEDVLRQNSSDVRHAALALEESSRLLVKLLQILVQASKRVSDDRRLLYGTLTVETTRMNDVEFKCKTELDNLVDSMARNYY